jgi:hypothetical protein
MSRVSYSPTVASGGHAESMRVRVSDRRIESGCAQEGAALAAGAGA